MDELEQDDSYLAARVQCHEQNEDGYCFWLIPGWITPEGDTALYLGGRHEAAGHVRADDTAVGYAFDHLLTSWRPRPAATSPVLGDADGPLGRP
jgi:hypothetical protein